jgi:hypothetical protein
VTLCIGCSASRSNGSAQAGRQRQAGEDIVLEGKPASPEFSGCRALNCILGVRARRTPRCAENLPKFRFRIRTDFPPPLTRRPRVTKSLCS